MSLCWLICFVVPNDDTDEPETRKNEMNASGPSRPKVSYFRVGNTQFFSQVICRYNDVLVLFHLYGRNSKCIDLQNSKNSSPPTL